MDELPSHLIVLILGEVRGGKHHGEGPAVIFSHLFVLLKQLHLCFLCVVWWVEGRCWGQRMIKLTLIDREEKRGLPL
jgi:hypothetical protein